LEDHQIQKHRTTLEAPEKKSRNGEIQGNPQYEKRRIARDGVTSAWARFFHPSPIFWDVKTNVHEFSSIHLVKNGKLSSSMSVIHPVEDPGITSFLDADTRASSDSYAAPALFGNICRQDHLRTAIMHMIDAIGLMPLSEDVDLVIKGVVSEGREGASLVASRRDLLEQHLEDLSDLLGTNRYSTINELLFVLSAWEHPGLIMEFRTLEIVLGFLNRDWRLVTTLRTTLLRCICAKYPHSFKMELPSQLRRGAGDPPKVDFERLKERILFSRCAQQMSLILHFSEKFSITSQPDEMKHTTLLDSLFSAAARFSFSYALIGYDFSLLSIVVQSPFELSSFAVNYAISSPLNSPTKNKGPEKCFDFADDTENQDAKVAKSISQDAGYKYIRPALTTEGANSLLQKTQKGTFVLRLENGKLGVSDAPEGTLKIILSFCTGDSVRHVTIRRFGEVVRSEEVPKYHFRYICGQMPECSSLVQMLDEIQKALKLQLKFDQENSSVSVGSLTTHGLTMEPWLSQAKNGNDLNSSLWMRAHTIVSQKDWKKDMRPRSGTLANVSSSSSLERSVHSVDSDWSSRSGVEGSRRSLGSERYDFTAYDNSQTVVIDAWIEGIVSIDQQDDVGPSEKMQPTALGSNEMIWQSLGLSHFGPLADMRTNTRAELAMATMLITLNILRKIERQSEDLCIHLDPIFSGDTTSCVGFGLFPEEARFLQASNISTVWRELFSNFSAYVQSVHSLTTTIMAPPIPAICLASQTVPTDVLIAEELWHAITRQVDADRVEAPLGFKHGAGSGSFKASPGCAPHAIRYQRDSPSPSAGETSPHDYPGEESIEVFHLDEVVEWLKLNQGCRAMISLCLSGSVTRAPSPKEIVRWLEKMRICRSVEIAGATPFSNTSIYLQYLDPWEVSAFRSPPRLEKGQKIRLGGRSGTRWDLSDVDGLTENLATHVRNNILKEPVSFDIDLKGNLVDPGLAVEDLWNRLGVDSFIVGEISNCRAIEPRENCVVMHSNLNHITPYISSLERRLYCNALFRRLSMSCRHFAIIQVNLLGLRDLSKRGIAVSGPIDIFGSFRLCRSTDASQQSSLWTQSGTKIYHDSFTTGITKAFSYQSSERNPSHSDQSIDTTGRAHSTAYTEYKWKESGAFYFPLPENIFSIAKSPPDNENLGRASGPSSSSMIPGSTNGDALRTLFTPPDTLQVCICERSFFSNSKLGSISFSLDNLTDSVDFKEWLPLSGDRGPTWLANIHVKVSFPLWIVDSVDTKAPLTPIVAQGLPATPSMEENPKESPPAKHTNLIGMEDFF
jgi:hypothetical protein